MAITIAIADVMADLAFELTLPAFAAGEFVTEVDALRMAKSSVSRLSGLLTRLYGDGFFAETATLTTVPDFDLVSLPDDFATLRSLHWVTSEGKAYELNKANPRDYVEEPAAWETCNPPTYALEANVIRLIPAPTEAYELRMGYTTGLFITTLTDTLSGQIGWSDWLVADMAITLRRRQQKDASDFMMRKAEVEAQIKEQASQRDRYAATQIVDRRVRRTRLF